MLARKKYLMLDISPKKKSLPSSQRPSIYRHSDHLNEIICPKMLFNSLSFLTTAVLAAQVAAAPALTSRATSGTSIPIFFGIDFNNNGVE